MTTPKPLDFGAWVKARMEPEGITKSVLHKETGIPYPSLSRLLDRGTNTGKLTRPDPDTVKKIADALVSLGVVEDGNEVWVAAGFLAEGYHVVRQFQKQSHSQKAELEVELDPDLQMIGEAYNGVSDAGRRMIKSAAELALEMSREGSIGKRAE